MWRSEDLHEQYQKDFSPATTYLRQAKDLGSGKARKLGLSYTASEAIDFLQNSWPHFLDIARAFDNENWSRALKAVRSAERAWKPIRDDLYKIEDEWAASGHRVLEKAVSTDSLRNLDSFLHQIQWKIEGVLENQ